MQKKLIMASWEIGHHNSPFGARVGGLGLVLQELPQEMVKFAQKQGKDLEIEILSPCFRFYDRSKIQYEGSIQDNHFHLDYDIFSYVFEDCKGQNVKHIYFWNQDLMGYLGDKENPQSLYPKNDWDALRLYARLSSAMATYIQLAGCSALHLHDYHLGLIPFYLKEEYMRLPMVFTIHNASYQGELSIWKDPGPVMYECSIPLENYYRYFQYWGNFNTMKGIVLKFMEYGKKITTVSTGYAQELTYNESDIHRMAQDEGCPFPRKVMIPNNTLSELSWARVVGIDNGLAQANLPQNLSFFKANFLKKLQSSSKSLFFSHQQVQEEMFSKDHNYSLHDLSNREELRRLAYLEFFQGIPEDEDILISAVGRLTQQKNFEVLLGVIDRLAQTAPNVYFAVLVSSSDDLNEQGYSSHIIHAFAQRAAKNPNLYFYSGFNVPLGKLAMAASQFCVVPSRFEPCGLVDYEASLLGSVPIVRKTGGLVKTFPYSFGYAWYDLEDYHGEVNRLSKTIEYAANEYIHKPDVYRWRMQGCMSLDTRWDNAVEEYLQYLGI